MKYKSIEPYAPPLKKKVRDKTFGWWFPRIWWWPDITLFNFTGIFSPYS